MLKRLLGLLAVTTMLSACAFVGNYPREGESEPPTIDLTSADVIGRWRNEARDGTLVFAADGTFEASNFPREVLEGVGCFTGAPGPVTLHGTWDLSEAIGTTGRKNDIALMLLPSEVIKHKSMIHIDPEWRGSVIGLVFYLGGDADLNITYVYLRTNDFSTSPTLESAGGSGAQAQPS